MRQKVKAGWLSPRNKKYTEERPEIEGRFSYAGISSTVDVQGSALCPGSTPGAPLHLLDNTHVVLRKEG